MIEAYLSLSYGIRNLMRVQTPQTDADVPIKIRCKNQAVSFSSEVRFRPQDLGAT